MNFSLFKYQARDLQKDIENLEDEFDCIESKLSALTISLDEANKSGEETVQSKRNLDNRYCIRSIIRTPNNANSIFEIKSNG